MACGSKAIIFLSILGIMIIVPLGLFVVANVLPSFYSSRSKLIKEYNGKAKIWQNDGIPYFKKASFSVSVGEKTYELSPYTKTFGDNYPIRDKCNKKGDPAGGCLSTDALYFRVEIPKEDMEQLPILLRNGVDGPVIYNGTYPISKKGVKDWDMLGCNTEESCKRKCAEIEGEYEEQIKLCRYTNYLNELCYRVNDDDGVYHIDHPPFWDLYYYTGYPGCEYSYDMAWREDYFLNGRKDTVLLSVRYYQDSYIQASSITTGCSSRYEEETDCLPTKSTMDVHVNQICFFLKFAAIIIVIIDVIVLVIFGITITYSKRKSKKSNTTRLV